MPELPEVETVLRGLRKRAVGRRIVAVEALHPGIITGDVEDFVSRIEGGPLLPPGVKAKYWQWSWPDQKTQKPATSFAVW